MRLKKFNYTLLVIISCLILVSCKKQTVNSSNGKWFDYNKNGQKDIYEDASRDTEERVVDLLSQMTLEEKMHQFRSWTYLNIDSWDPNELQLGLIGHIAHNAEAEAATKRINQVQKKQIEETRLGVPIIFFEEALHGLKTVKATSFPQAICLASTWDTTLMKQVAETIAIETKSRGIRQVLSPVVDLARDPRWGRAQETYGEDPFLASKMAVAFCKSFEDLGVVTTPKHFVANSGEGGRDSWAQYYSERYLNELYFQPYKACIQKAGSRSIMPSYGTLNGVPCVSDPWLLTKKARDEWGFKGYYGSDFNAVMNMMDLHHVSNDSSEIAAMSFNAGMDVEWPKAIYYDEPLEKALKKGRISEKTIHETAKRILTVKFDIGLFEDPYGDVEKAIATNDADEHRALARKAAEEGIVLLKNEEGNLPLDASKIRSLLVVGSLARDVKLGNYSGKGMKTVSLMEALEQQYPDMDIKFHRGVESSPTSFNVIPARIFKKGVNIKVFENNNFDGEPFVDKNINRLHFRSHGGNWGAPTRGKRWTNTSMKINATFIPDEDFTTRFNLEGKGDMSLYINNIQILNNKGTVGKKEGFFDDAMGQIGVLSDLGNPVYYTDFTFKKGTEYDFYIEYVHPDTPVMQASVSWDYKVGFEEDLKKLRKLAAETDAAIIVPDGIIEAEFKDRSTTCFPDGEELMIKAIAGASPNPIVVMVNGAAIAISNWDNEVPAIVEQWYAGEESGSALCNILFGKVNPSGKIPVTFPQIDGQLPLTYDYRPVGRSTGFQDPLNGTPQFSFGHGLSYTTFNYSDIALSKTKVKKGESLEVTFTITNTGDRDGAEIAQLYLHDEWAVVAQPIKTLKGFSKVFLKAGESQKVKITLTPDELSIWDSEMNFTMDPGSVKVWVGASSEDIRLEENFEIIL